PVAAVDLTSALPHIRAGKLIAVGVPSAKRTSLAPEIPTIAEAGVPGFERAPGFIGLLAPARTPPAVGPSLSPAIGAVPSTPAAQAKVRLLAAEVAYPEADAFAKFLADEAMRWKEALASMPASN